MNDNLYNLLYNDLIKKDSKERGKKINKLIECKVIDLDYTINELIKHGDSSLFINFIKYIEGLNIEKVTDIVIKSKEGNFIYDLAYFIKGENIQKLTDGIIASKDIKFIYYFAKDIKGVDLKKLTKAIVENEEINYNPQITEEIPQMQFQSAVNSSVQDNVKFSIPNVTQNVAYNHFSPDMPTNVAVLKNLISQLPAGVTKQVGALIIRQTIEALGISMNSVLQEAQQVQEGLNTSVRECSIKIQEYKNQIMQLEANARDYQMQMAQLNDLISLFIMTDNKRM